MKSLKKDEDYLYAKSKNYIEIMHLQEDNCSAIAENYDIYKMNSLKLIDQSIDNSRDFIIINIILRSIIRPNPTLTVTKFKGENKYRALHYHYDETSKKSNRVTDSFIATDNIEKKFYDLEDYFYNKQSAGKIFENFNDAQTHSSDFSTYYIVARISGKMITKKIYFADNY